MQFFWEQVGLIWQSIVAVWSWSWWVVLPVIALIVFLEFWEQYQRQQFYQSIPWKLLEIKIPKNILKTPKAMEQVFSAAYIEGEKHWMAFEAVGHAGDTHFYLRVPSPYRNMMESAIYAQYPEAEISEVDDYVQQMPRVMPNDEFDIFGVEQTLGNGEFAPIRTYKDFEDSVEERRIDTIALLMESMSKLKDSEQMWFQFIVKPVDEKWKKSAEKAAHKLLGVEEEKKKSSNPFAGFGLGLSFGEIVRAPFEHPNSEVKKKDEAPKAPKNVKPGDKDLAEGIRSKMAKLAFQATIRFMYVDRRGSFAKDNTNAAAAFFRQFNTQHLNYFKPDKETMTAGVKGWFKNWKIAFRKHAFYDAYAHARPRNNKCVLNTEELATIYHFPINAVGTTELEKVPSRKGGPPASLPLVE